MGKRETEEEREGKVRRLEGKEGKETEGEEK